MYVRRFTDPQQFRLHVEPFLVQHEAENHLMLGILSEILAGEYSHSPPYMASVENDDDILLVALRTPPHNLLLSSTNTLTTIPPLVEDLHSEYATLSGVSTVNDVSLAFAQQWELTSGQRFRLRMDEGIYQLQAVNALDYAQGILRPVKRDELDKLVDWYQSFMSGIYRDASDEAAKSAMKKVMSLPAEHAGLFIWQVNDIPVTMGGYTGATPNGFRISYVFTPPEYRRKGYATACTAAISQHVLDMGHKYCFLYTDLDYPTTNHIYQDIGYEFVCAVKQYQFD